MNLAFTVISKYVKSSRTVGLENGKVNSMFLMPILKKNGLVMIIQIALTLKYELALNNISDQQFTNHNLLLIKVNFIKMHNLGGAMVSKTKKKHSNSNSNH
jgi:hypothetical protein